nr:MAG TPA: hypothetical protein [Caudoviricetes sp.]
MSPFLHSKPIKFWVRNGYEQIHKVQLSSTKFINNYIRKCIAKNLSNA